MARHDVYRGAGAYLLDCQSDYLGSLVATQLGSSVPARHLRDPVTSLANQHDAIMNAFDVLLTGY